MSRQGWWLTMQPEEPVSGLVAALRDVGLLPEGQTWWFAWNALDIVLPGMLTDADVLNHDWEVARAFSPRAELRIGRRGRGRGYWLLLEEEPRGVLGHLHGLVRDSRGDFLVEAGFRLLAGRKLRLPQGERRGEIIYPRPLDYGLAEDDLDHALVADVHAYYDDAYRLITVRYRTIRHVPRGSICVPPFPEAREAVELALDRQQGSQG